MNVSFFARHVYINGKIGSGAIRGVQISERMGAKLNPVNDYQDDVCIYIKTEVPKDAPKKAYLDIVDARTLVPWLLEHPEIKVISSSLSGYEFLIKMLKRDDIVLIPQHHCNYERVIRDRKGIKVVGVMGRPESMFDPMEEVKEKLKEIGIEYRIQSRYKSREDIVDFYKQIDVQVIGKRRNRSLKNSLKIVNACSFGIPTIAVPEIGYEDMKDFYTPVNSVDELIEEVKSLKNGWDASRLIKKAEECHIDNIIKLYQKL